MKQDQSTEHENFNQLKFSGKQGFFDKNLGIKLLIGVFFFLCLFVVLHFREIRVEVLELNSIAPGYIVAQVDFDFLDEEATTLRRLESVKELGKIYKIPETELRQRRAEFESYLGRDDSWRKISQDSSLESLYKAIDEIVKVLNRSKFTDPRTLQRMRDLHLTTTNYQIFSPAKTEEPVFIPPIIWNLVKKTASGTDPVPAEYYDFVVGYFSEKKWDLKEDLSAENSLATKVKHKIPDIYSHISSGSRIIDKGEKVNARHIAILQAMKSALNEKRKLWDPLTLLGSFILAFGLTIICGLYFRIYYPLIMQSNRKLFLIVTLCVMTMGFAKITELLLLYSKSNLIEVVRYPLFAPFAALLLCSLLNAQVATFASGFLTVVLSVALAFDREGFLLLNIAAGIIVILSTRSLERRKEIFLVCAKAAIACSVLIMAIQLYSGNIGNYGLLVDVMSSGLFMLLTGVAVIGILPLLEALFGMVTDVTLMEYMDPNNELLRKLSIEATGTYQHSIVVGNLAEAAALAIDANGLFCRVATLYHDIGKMATPRYFTENQQGGMNIHQLLTPQESAQVIMAHVPEGVSMARKAGLPEQFIDIIKEHHGTTLVYYFYRKQLDKVEGDTAKVNEKDYRYAGPTPRSKESAIIMIADSLEAASRSLESIDEDSVAELADRLIRQKADDGQFDKCLLTYEEMAIIKETLVKTLVAFSHSRVKYPNLPDSKHEEIQGEVPSSVA